MATTQAQAEKKVDAAVTKFLEGKYDSQEAMEKGYRELENKLSEQGGELGTLRKQTEESTKSMQQYADWVQTAKPIVDWYNQNGTQIQQLLQNQNQTQANTVPAQNTTAGDTYDLLSAAEKQRLIQETAQHLIDKSLGPWTQNLAKQVEQYGQTRSKEIDDRLMQHQRSFSDVLWRTLEHVVPKDQLDRTREWHTESLKFADPSKFDPMTHANEYMTLKMDNSKQADKVKELETKLAEQEKLSTPSLGDTSGLFTATKDDKIPVSREDRFKTAIEAVQEEHGTEGTRALFPTLGR